MENLSLVPTDDLLDELFKRHDALVVTGMKFTASNGAYVTLRRFNGNRYVCNGMLDTMQALIVREELNAQYIIPDNKKLDS